MRRTRHDLDKKILVLSLCCSVIAALPAFSATFGRDTADRARPAGDLLIRVTDFAGDVDVEAAGTKRPDIAVGDAVDLPARIVTGADGTIALQQSETRISIAPDSDVEIPEAASDGQLIARLVQWRGNVFYDVEQRGVDKLRVETPHLVAVVKGTQFNVSAQGDTTTVSLFEGRLEIRTPDGSDVVDLAAGEIAIRTAADAAIRVLRMDAVALPEQPADTERPVGFTADGLAAGRTGERLDAIAEALPRGALLDSEVDADLRNLRAADLSVDIPAGLAAVDASASPLDAELDLDLGGVVLEAGLGDIRADVGLDAGLDLGAATADVGLDAGLDLGAATADIGLDAGLDLGAATADVGLDAGLDLGAATADVGLDAGLDLGAATADVGLDTGLDLDGATADVGLDADLGLGGSDADVDADLGLGGDSIADADLSVGGTDVGIELGGDDSLIDVDLGGGEDDGGLLDVDLPLVGSGGLLGGLL